MLERFGQQSEFRQRPMCSMSRAWSVLGLALLHACSFVSSGIAQDIAWGMTPQQAIELVGEPKEYFPGDHAVMFYDAASAGLTMLFEEQRLTQITVSMDASIRLTTLTVTPDTLPILAAATGLLGAFLRGEGDQAYDQHIAEFFSSFSQPRFLSTFATIPWGTSRTDLIREKGEPVREFAISDTLAIDAMLYRDNVLGEDVLVVFAVQDDEGLVMGDYYVNYDSNIECVLRFQKFKDAITERYPEIVLYEFKGGQEGPDLCGDGAAWTASWDDPASMARIEMRVNRNMGAVEVNYMGPSWFAWAKRMRDVELGRKF